MSKINLETVVSVVELWSWSLTDTDGLQFLGVCSLKKITHSKILIMEETLHRYAS